MLRLDIGLMRLPVKRALRGALDCWLEEPEILVAMTDSRARMRPTASESVPFGAFLCIDSQPHLGLVAASFPKLGSITHFRGQHTTRW